MMSARLLPACRLGSLCVASLLLLAACSGETPIEPPGGGSSGGDGGGGGGGAAGVQLEATSTRVQLRLGGAASAPVQLVGADGRTMPLTGVTFRVRGDLVADVNAGTIRALEPGVDTLVAFYGDDSLTVEIDVQYPDGISHPAGTVGATMMLGSRPFGLAIAPDGSMLATQLDASLVGRGTVGGSFEAEVPVGWIPTDVTVDSAGTYAYVTNQGSNNVGVIDLASNAQVATIPLGASTYRVRLTGDGSKLLVTGSRTQLYVIDVATRQLVDSVTVGQAANGLALDYTGRYVWVSNQYGGTVDEVDLATMSVVKSLPVGGHPQEIVLSPGSTLLFVADEAGSVQVWSVRDEARRGSFEIAGGAFAMAVSPDWRQLYISSALGGTVYLVDWKTGATLQAVETGGTPRRIAFTQDGLHAAVANEGGWVSIIE